jgi:Outer membrane protein beta-barrel domain
MPRLLLVVFAVLIAASPAVAQEDRPVGVNFGGGWAFPVSGLRDAFDTGWNGGIGVTFNITPTVGFQAEYMYDRMGGPDRNIGLSPTPTGLVTESGFIESNHQMHTGTFNLVFSPGTIETSRPVGGYFIGGLGIYHRLIQLTTPSVGYTTICDPYWYVCYPTLVSVDRIIGDRSSNDFGINLGAGLTFGKSAKFYVESRWHYVWGPKITVASEFADVEGELDPCPDGCSTNAQYFPLTFGFRW